MFEALNVSLLASETITKSLRGIGMAADSAGDAAAESGVEFGAFGEALDAVDDDALQMAFATNTAKNAVDEVGDEALQSAAEMQALDSQMNDVARSSVGLAGSLGPLRGGLRTIGPLAAGIVPPLVSLSGALGGVAAAGGAAAGGIAAIAGAGLQRQAEQMAAASSEFKDSSEAMEAIFGDVKAAISEAFAPLKTAANTEFAMAGLEGIVELSHAAAEGIAQMQDSLKALGSTFGASVIETAPAIFDELDTTIQELRPTLEGFADAIRDIPAAIAWFRQQAVALQPELGNVTGSAIGAAAAVGRFGTSVLEVVLPPLSVLLNALAWTANLLAGIPKPLLAAAGAAAVAAGAYSLYTSSAFAATLATQGLIAALGVLTAPISGTALVIGALVGAIAGVITYFGLWGDIIGVITGVWNGLVEIVEFAIEVTYAMITAIGDILGPIALVLGPLGILIWTVNNLGTIVEWAGEMFRWFSGLVNDVVSAVMGWVDTAVSALQSLMDWAMKVVNAIPGVNIDFGNIQETIELDAIKAGGGDEGGETPEQKKTEQTKNEAKNVYDFSGADFGGASQSQVERTVTEAVRKANRESRQREDAQSF
jgi:hypothetical protein